MSKISTWSTIADNNNMAVPNGWPEGQPPSSVNDCARLMMATIRTQMNDAQWFDWGFEVERASNNSFQATDAGGDAVPVFEVGRRIKLISDSTIYATVTAVVNGAGITTVTFLSDGLPLTAALDAVFTAILTPTNTSIPTIPTASNVVTQAGTQIYAADTGAANAYVVTLAPAITAYTTGMRIYFKATNANTTASTVNVNGLGVKTISKLGDVALSAGDIKAGQLVELSYDGTNMQMLSQIATPPPSPYAYPGVIVQVLSTTKNDVFDTNSAAYVDIPGLSVTITPRSATNKILVIYNVAAMGNTALPTNGNGFLQLYRAATPVNIGAAAGTRTSASNMINYNFANTTTFTSPEISSNSGNYLDSPATVAATTYSLKVKANPNSTLYINRSSADTDNAAHGRVTSTITVMEVVF